MTYAEQLRTDYAAVRARLFAPSKIRDTAPPPVCRDIKVPRADDKEPKKPARKITIRGIKWLPILAEVAKKHGVPETGLKMGTRGICSGAPRNELYYRLREELGLTSPQIGRLLGRDHSTVTNGTKKWKRDNGL